MIFNRPQVALEQRILLHYLHEMNTQYGFHILPSAHIFNPIASFRSEFYVFVTQCFPKFSPWEEPLKNIYIFFSHLEELRSYKNEEKETFGSAWSYSSISNCRTKTFAIFRGVCGVFNRNLIFLFMDSIISRRTPISVSWNFAWEIWQ